MILRRVLNYRKIELTESNCAETVGVLRKDGTLRYCRWRGFIDLYAAKQMPGALPVKLAVEAYADCNDFASNWVVVPDAQFLQGCLVDAGVYCVLRGGAPRLVARCHEKHETLIEQRFP